MPKTTILDNFKESLAIIITNFCLSSDGKTKTRTWMDSEKTEQLKSKLNDEQYKVVVERGTEKAFSGKYSSMKR